jgi:DNA-binding transcriptional ArsR family regulator
MPPVDQPEGPEDDDSALHRRPAGVDDATVAAMGKLDEALETVEEARGHLYAMHRLTGSADLALGEALDALEDAGHVELAQQVREELVGRNVLAGRWTYQVVEEYDDGYYATFRRLEELARRQLVDGHRHVFEAEMKARRRTPGRPGHEATPEPGVP